VNFTRLKEELEQELEQKVEQRIVSEMEKRGFSKKT
jgi:hypothetical protein